MRWRIGSYEVKYNPKSNDKSWNSRENVNTSVRGNVSNPNLVFDGSHSFTIDIYDKPTHVSKTPTTTGSYISVTEERMTNRLFLLKNNGTYDIKNSDGTLYATGSISDGMETLPLGYPVAIKHIENEIAFLYKATSQSTIVITDKNGNANRKYIYDSIDGDVNNIDSICWDFDGTIYAVNPYGKVYAISIGTGTPVFLYEFADYEENKANSFKKYTSVFSMDKQGKQFFGVMQNKKDFLIFDSSVSVVSKIETKMSNVADMSYSNYSQQFYIIVGNKIIQMFPNTCRLDVEIIKSIVANGEVTIYDERGFPSVIVVKDLRIARNRNMHEAKYEIGFNADIAYSNQTFNDKWHRDFREV